MPSNGAQGQVVFYGCWVLLPVMRHLGFLFWPKLLNLAQEIGQGRELTCFHNSCWFPKCPSLLTTGTVYLTCDNNYSCAGQQPSHTCPRKEEKNSSLSKDRTNICTALPAEIQVLQMYPLALLRQLLSFFVPVRKRIKMFIFLRPALHSRPSARGESGKITIRVHLPPSPGLCSSNSHPKQTFASTSDTFKDASWICRATAHRKGAISVI